MHLTVYHQGLAAGSSYGEPQCSLVSLAMSGIREGWPQECLAIVGTWLALAHGRVFGYNPSQGGSGGP